MDEKVLINKLKQGDTTAVDHLFNSHYKPLCSYALQFTNGISEAEDVVQNVFVKLWANRESLNIQKSVKSYLYRAVYNTALNTFRSKKKDDQLIDSLKYQALTYRMDEDDSDLTKRIEKLKQLIASLPARCREVLLLSKRDGLKNREVAEKMGISIKTVEAQLSIAFKKIREGFKGGPLLLFLLAKALAGMTCITFTESKESRS